MSSTLFLRTLSQTLQALTPIAMALAWLVRGDDARAASAIRRGVLLSLPAMIAGAWLFQQASHQAVVEAVLASIAVAIAAIAGWNLAAPPVGQDRPNTTRFAWPIVCAVALIVVRQTMEVAAALETAAFDVRLLDPTMAIVAGFIAGAGLASALRRIVVRLPDRAALAATRAFVVAFVALGTLYAFHEFAEARWLPASEILHAATEPYGPDGIYGVHFSDLLLIVPLVAAAAALVRAAALWIPLRRAALASLALTAAVLIGLRVAESAQRGDDRAGADAAAIAAIRAKPYVLFRDVSRSARPGAIPHAGMLSVAPLDEPDTRRVATDVPCERVSFAADHGLCLHTTPGIFPHYTAAVLGRGLRPLASNAIDGRPSRTRTSPDGRIGAITVFVFGDNYAAPFSTRTTLVDLAAGETIGELEQFSTWRDGARFRAADFNFWGVTFAGDGSTFYATLRTGGSTYLVRGELALRRLTVLRGNVECPSLSPDDKLIAFKKRVGAAVDDWRLEVLDVRTLTERPIAAEARRVDDQLEWLDASHVLYAVPGGARSIADVWVAPIDGSEPARIFLHDAESPIVVRSGP
jgi:hypothetical protein